MGVKVCDRRWPHLDDAGGVHDAGVVRVQVTAKRSVKVKSSTGVAATRSGQGAYDIAAGVGVAGGSSRAGGSETGTAAAAAAAVPLGPLTGYLRAALQDWAATSDAGTAHSSSPPTRSVLLFSEGMCEGNGTGF